MENRTEERFSKGWSQSLRRHARILFRASTPVARQTNKTWVAGTSPAMMQRTSESHLPALADGAEMLVDAEHDQEKLADDASEENPHRNPDHAAQDRENPRERMQRHQRKTRYDAGQPEQAGDAHGKPIKKLDDRGRDEAFPLKQVTIVEHRGFSSPAVIL